MFNLHTFDAIWLSWLGTCTWMYSKVCKINIKLWNLTSSFLCGTEIVILCENYAFVIYDKILHYTYWVTYSIPSAWFITRRIWHNPLLLENVTYIFCQNRKGLYVAQTIIMVQNIHSGTFLKPTTSYF